VDVSQTKDGAFVLINCNSKNTSEIHALSSGRLDAQPRLLREREPGTAYFADHAGGRFFIVTNADQAANYKIATCASGEDVSDDWSVLLPEQSDVKIEDVDLLDDYLVLYERVASVPRIRVCQFGEASKGGPTTWGVTDLHVVQVPEQHAICRVTPGVNRDFTARSVRFSLSTPLEPEIVYDYDLAARVLTVRKQAVIETSTVSPASAAYWIGEKSGKSRLRFNADKFTCHRSFVPSSGGAKVPLTLIHRQDLPLNGTNPTLLVAYGAYGHNLEADFTLEHLSLLERGWVIALAHVRGGGELGLRWYEDGKQLHKRNSFDDYTACARFLIERGVTSPEWLAGKGASAGGLIMGVVANEHPELFRALVMKVPFVDILETMSDPTLPLTVHEYDEWGNPNAGYGDDAAAAIVRDYIRSYAPCENVRVNGKSAFPSILVTGSMNDQRVQYWEPVKWIWKLRRAMAERARLASQESSDAAAKKAPARSPLLLLKMSEEDGHFGGGGRLEQLQESAMEMAFLYQAMRLPFTEKQNE
jgi:oligopeptidase B